MIIWIDAQLSPAIAKWISASFGVNAVAVRDLQLREASDEVIFETARQPGTIVMTKDIDFVRLLDRFGPPPSVIWVTCGNTSNDNLKSILERSLPSALNLLNAGEALVEVR